jgi:hypothetical protein
METIGASGIQRDVVSSSDLPTCESKINQTTTSNAMNMRALVSGQNTMDAMSPSEKESRQKPGLSALV